jgi:hypothetical protein
MKKIFRTWWPLAASWMLMALETPMLSAVIARLAEPEKHLATWGGVVFPLSLLIEAPVIMLLAGSTALSKDMASYQKLRRYMMAAGASLTVLHFLVAFTPLFDIVVVGLMDPPQEIIEPARIGLRIMLPWTWSIAYRRFNQGVLIRFGHSRAVGQGTVVRLVADVSVLTIGAMIGSLPGIVVATAAVASGVILEAIYAGIRVRPVLREEVSAAAPTEKEITLRGFLGFYVPLAMTSLLTMIILPMGSAAMSRMPNALQSLAVWPVLSGLVFMFRSLGVAYNEVMVALLDEPGVFASLRRYSTILILITTGLLLLILTTPVADLWFRRLSGLSVELATLSKAALWFALPAPALSVLQSFFQGILLNNEKTRGITESMIVFLFVAGAILWVGIATQAYVGVYVAWIAFSAGYLAQSAYLWLRSRSSIRAFQVSRIN